MRNYNLQLIVNKHIKILATQSKIMLITQHPPIKEQK